MLIQNLSDTPELRAAGVAPPSRQLAILLLGGLRELIATTVEDSGDIADITEVTVRATQALLGPRRLGPTIQQLSPEWSLPQKEEPQLPADFWETLAGQQIRNQDRSRLGLLAAIALLNKRKAEILMMFDHVPDLQRQMRAIDAEIARRVEQLPEADRGYLHAPPQ